MNNKDQGIRRVEGTPQQRNAFFAFRPWMTVKQAADYLNVHPRTISEWVASGRIAFVDINRDKENRASQCLRFYADDLDRFMMMGRVGALWEKEFEAARV